MRQLYSCLLIGLVAIMLSSCNDLKIKRQIHNLQSLTEDVRQNGRTFSQEDWDRTFRDFQKISNELDRLPLSNNQLHEVGRLKGEYVAACTACGIQAAGGLLNSFFRQAAGALDGFLNEMEAELPVVEEQFNQMLEEMDYTESAE